jgi:hypothetical protein
VDQARATKADMAASLLMAGMTNSSLSMTASALTLPQPGYTTGLPLFSDGSTSGASKHYSNPLEATSRTFSNLTLAAGKITDAGVYGQMLTNMRTVPHPTKLNMNLGLGVTDIFGPSNMVEPFMQMALQTLALQTVTFSGTDLAAATTNIYTPENLNKAMSMISAAGMSSPRYHICPQLDAHPYIVAHPTYQMWFACNASHKGAWAEFLAPDVTFTPRVTILGDGTEEAAKTRKVRIITDLDAGVAAGLPHFIHAYFETNASRTVAIAYATIQEMFRLALAAPAFVAYARPFDAVDAATATIRIKGHGLTTGDTVTFEGSPGGQLPTGITEFITYPVTVISADLFRVNTPMTALYVPLSFSVNATAEKVYVAVPVSLGTVTVRLDGFEVDTLTPVTVTSGGIQYQLVETTNNLTGASIDFAIVTSVAPVAWTDAGEGWGIAIDPAARLQAILEERTGFINEHLIAHGGKIDPDPITGLYPSVLVGLCARMAARQAIASLEVENPQYAKPIDVLMSSKEADERMLADWKKGKPISPYPTDDTPDIVENAARASSLRDEMPWSTGRML